MRGWAGVAKDSSSGADWSVPIRGTFLVLALMLALGVQLSLAGVFYYSTLVEVLSTCPATIVSRGFSCRRGDGPRTREYSIRIAEESPPVSARDHEVPFTSKAACNKCKYLHC